MNVGELFFNLGFKSSGMGKVKDFESSILSARNASTALAETSEGMKPLISNLKQLGLNFTALTLGITASVSALLAFTKISSNAAVNVDKISTLTGLSADTVQRMGAMAAQTGSSLNEMASAVQALQKQSVDIALGRGGNIGTFQFLGLDPHENPLTLLDKLAAKLKTMPTALGTSMAKDLGLSDDLIYFLKNKQNLPPIAENTLPTDKELKRLKDFDFLFNRVFEQSKRVLQKFAALLTPSLTVVLNAFDRLSIMFADIVEKSSPFFEMIKSALPWLVGIGIVLFAAFFPLTAAIAVLVLVLEDLWSFVKGDDSLFGRMLKWLGDIETRTKEVIKTFWRLVQFFTIGGETKYKEYFEAKIKGVDTQVDEWAKKLKEQENVPSELGKYINKDLKGGTGMPTTEGFKDLWQNFKGLFEGKFDLKTIGPLEMPKELGQNINNQNTININVDGSKSPIDTANTINKKIAEAFYQFGVREA